MAALGSGIKIFRSVSNPKLFQPNSIALLTKNITITYYTDDRIIKQHDIKRQNYKNHNIHYKVKPVDDPCTNRNNNNYNRIDYDDGKNEEKQDDDYVLPMVEIELWEKLVKESFHIVKNIFYEIENKMNYSYLNRIGKKENDKAKKLQTQLTIKNVSSRQSALQDMHRAISIQKQNHRYDNPDETEAILKGTVIEPKYSTGLRPLLRHKIILFNTITHVNLQQKHNTSTDSSKSDTISNSKTIGNIRQNTSNNNKIANYYEPTSLRNTYSDFLLSLKPIINNVKHQYNLKVNLKYENKKKLILEKQILSLDSKNLIEIFDKMSKITSFHNQYNTIIDDIILSKSNSVSELLFMEELGLDNNHPIPLLNNTAATYNKTEINTKSYGKSIPCNNDIEQTGTEKKMLKEKSNFAAHVIDKDSKPKSPSQLSPYQDSRDYNRIQNLKMYEAQPKSILKSPFYTEFNQQLNKLITLLKSLEKRIKGNTKIKEDYQRFKMEYQAIKSALKDETNIKPIPESPKNKGNLQNTKQDAILCPAQDLNKISLEPIEKRKTKTTRKTKDSGLMKVKRSIIRKETAIKSHKTTQKTYVQLVREALLNEGNLYDVDNVELFLLNYNADVRKPDTPALKDESKKSEISAANSKLIVRTNELQQAVTNENSKPNVNCHVNVQQEGKTPTQFNQININQNPQILEEKLTNKNQVDNDGRGSCKSLVIPTQENIKLDETKTKFKFKENLSNNLTGLMQSINKSMDFAFINKSSILSQAEINSSRLYLKERHDSNPKKVKIPKSNQIETNFHKPFKLSQMNTYPQVKHIPVYESKTQPQKPAPEICHQMIQPPSTMLKNEITNAENKEIADKDKSHVCEKMNSKLQGKTDVTTLIAQLNPFSKLQDSFKNIGLKKSISDDTLLNNSMAARGLIKTIAKMYSMVGDRIKTELEKTKNTFISSSQTLRKSLSSITQSSNGMDREEIIMPGEKITHPLKKDERKGLEENNKKLVESSTGKRSDEMKTETTTLEKQQDSDIKINIKINLPSIVINSKLMPQICASKEMETAKHKNYMETNKYKNYDSFKSNPNLSLSQYTNKFYDGTNMIRREMTNFYEGLPQNTRHISVPKRMARKIMSNNEVKQLRALLNRNVIQTKSESQVIWNPRTIENEEFKNAAAGNDLKNPEESSEALEELNSSIQMGFISGIIKRKSTERISDTIKPGNANFLQPNQQGPEIRTINPTEKNPLINAELHGESVTNCEILSEILENNRKKSITSDKLKDNNKIEIKPPRTHKNCGGMLNQDIAPEYTHKAIKSAITQSQGNSVTDNKPNSLFTKPVRKPSGTFVSEKVNAFERKHLLSIKSQDNMGRKPTPLHPKIPNLPQQTKSQVDRKHFMKSENEQNQLKYKIPVLELIKAERKLDAQPKNMNKKTKQLKFDPINYSVNDNNTLKQKRQNSIQSQNRVTKYDKPEITIKTKIELTEDIDLPPKHERKINTNKRIQTLYFNDSLRNNGKENVKKADARLHSQNLSDKKTLNINRKTLSITEFDTTGNMYRQTKFKFKERNNQINLKIDRQLDELHENIYMNTTSVEQVHKRLSNRMDYSEEYDSVSRIKLARKIIYEQPTTSRSNIFNVSSTSPISMSATLFRKYSNHESYSTLANSNANLTRSFSELNGIPPSKEKYRFNSVKMTDINLAKEQSKINRYNAVITKNKEKNRTENSSKVSRKPVPPRLSKHENIDEDNRTCRALRISQHENERRHKQFYKSINDFTEQVASDSKIIKLDNIPSIAMTTGSLLSKPKSFTKILLQNSQTKLLNFHKPMKFTSSGHLIRTTNLIDSNLLNYLVKDRYSMKDLTEEHRRPMTKQ